MSFDPGMGSMMLSAKNAIRSLVLADETMTIEEIQQALERKGIKLSEIAISGIRSEFRSTLRFLEREGLLERRPQMPDVRLPPRPPPKTTTRKKRFRPWHFSG
jgi:hypothetical protein